MENFQGKVAVVTGASKGIGAGIAKDLAAAGASVVVNYASSKGDAERVVEEIKKAGGKAIAVQGDVSKAPDVTRIFAETKKTFGRLDILVNNAGVYEFLPLEQITDQHYDRLFDINVKGVLLATKEAAKYFGDNGGTVVNISSLASQGNLAGSAVYSGTKGALDAITRVLAVELAPKKIRVNSVNPGPVVTEGVKAVGFEGSDLFKEFVARTPLARVGQPNDIAQVVSFLASPNSGWLTGEVLFATGGLR